MHVLYRVTMLSLAIAMGLLLSAAGVALAGDYHMGDGLHCTDCHIMHASRNGTTYNGSLPNPTGLAYLLKGTGNGICLSCHDGTDTTAPDIVASGTAASPNNTLGIAYASAYKNSGGYFQSDYATVANEAAHDLYAASALTAIQGTWTSSASGMKCADCHDPHGNDNYRNVVLRPGGVGSDITITAADSGAGLNVYLEQAITIPATAVATAAHYDTSAVGFDDQNPITDWCIGCHTNIATGNKHPQDADVSLAEGSHWTGGSGSGFGDSTVGGGSSGIPRVRFAQDGGTFAAVTTVATTNEVMCLSCHKAHGSHYDSTLVWPYYTTDNVDQTSACDQCHNKGA